MYHHSATNSPNHTPTQDRSTQDRPKDSRPRRRGWRRWVCRTVVAVASVVAVVGVGSPAWAAEPSVLAADTLPVIVNNITVWITGLLVGVATLFLTIGGLRYLAAGGDPTEVEKAKSAFRSALIGYALAVLAPVLLTVVQGWIGG